MMKFNHPYHLVTLSPWPLACSLNILILLSGMIKFFHELNTSLLFFSLMSLILNLIQWWRDIIRESTTQGNHTLIVMKGLKYGMLLFICSEVMFFMSFFWCYFHMFLAPSVDIGGIWYPKNIIIFNPYNIPLLNTLILLSSGASITLCHHSILNSNFKIAYPSMYLTIILGMIFTFFQFLEYNEAFFCINNSVFGSIFYVLTGFHGLHVIIGTTFNMIMLFRMMHKHFSCIHFFGFEASSWYWHFVDLVWLFVYIMVYWLIF